MAVLGIFTNQGITKAQQAQNNDGFKIYPTDFSVSDTFGLLDPTRTTPNPEWYVGPISSRVVVDFNTIKFICTIPPAATPVNRTVREIYIKGIDSNLDPFIFVIAQPSTPIVYDPSGSVTFEIDLSLANADISSIVVFNFTQATEINEHNTSPNSHPEIHAALNRAGHFLPLGAGGEPFKYRGQSYDEKAEWAGVKASNTYGGLIFTATHTGTDGNSITLTFDGIKTVDQVRLAWNNLNPFNTVEHNGLGTEILAVGSTTLINGALSVAHGDAVYLDVDGFYKRALADGTLASKVAGFADLDAPSKRIVRSSGFIAHDTTGFVPGDSVFVSTTVPGAITNVSTPVKMGFVVKTGVVQIGTGAGGGGSAEGFDCVVTNVAGFGNYPTTQLAITNCPDGGRILVDKIDFLTSTLDVQNKRIDFHFNGPEAGWSRYLGTQELQRISFGSLPDSGTLRIEWDGGETADLPFNSNAAAIQAAINGIVGPNVAALPVSVTGSMGAGFFDILWTGLIDVPQITFANVGQNEKQRIAFGNIPDNGTVQFDFNGQLTANFAWNDNAAILEGYLEALSNISDVVVTGSFAAGFFDVEWVNADGNQNQPLITVNSNTLSLGITPTTVNITTLTPGKSPANSLLTGVNPVSIVVQTLTQGSAAGPSLAIQLDEDYTRFIGAGIIENFSTGIDLNSNIGTDVEMQFINTTLPILHTGLSPRKDYHRDKSFGMPDVKQVYVGPFGDYLDLASAITGSSAGDKIYVAADQSITAPLVINKEVEIEFIDNKKLLVAAPIVGDIITFDGKVKTKNWKVLVDVAGAYNTVFKFLNDRGHHVNLDLELDNGTVSVDTAFELGATCKLLYLDGSIVRNSATLTSVLSSSTGFGSNNVFIRDQELSIVHNTLSDTSLEEDIVATNGQTIFNFNVLRFDPSNTKWDLKSYLDGIKSKQDPSGGLTQHFRKLSNTSIEYSFPMALGEVITGRMEKSVLTSLGTQPYFVNYYQSLTGSLISTGDAYNPGTNKLSMYRNGVYQNQSLSLGTPGERYTEVSSTNILTGLSLIPADWIAFVNEDLIPSRSQVTGLTGAVLTTPSYLMGSGRLRVYRNGVLMNTSGLGASYEQYAETSSTSITLALASNISDIWTFYVAAITPVFRSEQTGIVGSVITIPAYVIGDERLLAYKNGILILNSLTLATSSERYQEATTTTVILGAPSIAGDWWSFIYK